MNRRITHTLSPHETPPRSTSPQGANLNVLDKYGDGPLNYAAQEAHWEVAELLVREGADFSLRNEEGETPLVLAAQHGGAAFVGFLVGRGADVDTADNDGWTPLHWAARNGHYEAARVRTAC